MLSLLVLLRDSFKQGCLAGSGFTDFKDEAEGGEVVLLVFDSVEADQLFVTTYLEGLCRLREVARVVAKKLGVGTVEEFELTEPSATDECSVNLTNLSVGIKVVGNRMVMGNTCFLKQG